MTKFNLLSVMMPFAIVTLLMEPAGHLSFKTEGDMVIFGLIIRICDFSWLRVYLFATIQRQILLRFAIIYCLDHLAM